MFFITQKLKNVLGFLQKKQAKKFQKDEKKLRGFLIFLKISKTF